MNMLLTSNLISLDIPLLLILLIYVLVGQTKGFANYMLSFIGTIVAFVLAIILCDDLLKVLQSSKLYLDVKTFFVNLFPVDNNGTLESLGLSNFIVVKALQELGANIDLSTAVSRVLTNLFLSFGCFLVILASVKIICYLLKEVFNELTKFPFVCLANKLLGGATGLINGILVISAVLFLVSIFPISALEGFRNLIQSSLITKFLYNNNIYTVIF